MFDIFIDERIDHAHVAAERLVGHIGFFETPAHFILSLKLERQRCGGTIKDRLVRIHGLGITRRIPGGERKLAIALASPRGVDEMAFGIVLDDFLERQDSPGEFTQFAEGIALRKAGLRQHLTIGIFLRHPAVALDCRHIIGLGGGGTPRPVERTRRELVALEVGENTYEERFGLFVFTLVVVLLRQPEDHFRSPFRVGILIDKGLAGFDRLLDLPLEVEAEAAHVGCLWSIFALRIVGHRFEDLLRLGIAPQPVKQQPALVEADYGRRAIRIGLPDLRVFIQRGLPLPPGTHHIGRAQGGLFGKRAGGMVRLQGMERGKCFGPAVGFCK